MNRNEDHEAICNCKKRQCLHWLCSCKRYGRNCTRNCNCNYVYCQNKQKPSEELEEYEAGPSRTTFPPVSPTPSCFELTHRTSSSISIRMRPNPGQRINLDELTVAEVGDFIGSIPGCSNYVEQFIDQEIDGKALLLLKQEHLTNWMSVKLGPALKICDRIKMNVCHNFNSNSDVARLRHCDLS